MVVHNSACTYLMQQLAGSGLCINHRDVGVAIRILLFNAQLQVVLVQVIDRSHGLQVGALHSVGHLSEIGGGHGLEEPGHHGLHTLHLLQ